MPSCRLHRLKAFAVHPDISSAYFFVHVSLTYKAGFSALLDTKAASWLPSR
jgi:hypothetical protein